METSVQQIEHLGPQMMSEKAILELVWGVGVGRMKVNCCSAGAIPKQNKTTRFAVERV